MANDTAQKFINRNGTFNTMAAMQAGHEARTDGLRALIKMCTSLGAALIGRRSGSLA